MKFSVSFLVLALLLSGCVFMPEQKKVSKDVIIIPVVPSKKIIKQKERYSSVLERTQSCTTSGYCYTCANGCKYQHSSSCPGSRRNVVRSTVYDVVYDDGTTGRIERSQILEMGSCKAR